MHIHLKHVRSNDILGELCTATDVEQVHQQREPRSTLSESGRATLTFLFLVVTTLVF